jgi:hypothetical protein
LQKQGYKFAKRKFPNKKKRTCYNCGSTEHFIADFPNEKRENKNDKGKGNYKKDQRPHYKRRNYSGEAHIGHEWNSGDENSSDEEKKVATVATKKLPSTTRLFNNLTDDEESSSIHCFMSMGEKVIIDSKPSSPPSDESEIDSSDESSGEEANQLVSDMDKQSRDFMARLIVEIKKCQDTLRSERSVLEALHLEVNQVESVIATLKEDLAASQAQCNALKLRNEDLEEQYSFHWSSTSHPLKAKGNPSASTSKGCDKCYNIDLESYATNLANMEALKKEIAMLNSIIARGCMSEGNKKGKFFKRKMLEKSEKPGFGYVEGVKTNERSSRKKSVLNSRALGFCLPRPWRFRAPSPDVLKSGSLEPHKLGSPEVPRKFSKVPGTVTTEQRRRARLCTSIVPRHLTLIRRFRIIQSCLEEICLPTRTRLMHLETYLQAMC